MAPETTQYTHNHEWVRRRADDETVRVGITDYAQRQLGDVVFVQLPEVGQRVDAGTAIGEVESTKSVSEIYAPVAGEILARNDQLADQPELINSAPHDQGWMFEVRLSGSANLDDLLDEAAYRELIEQE